MARVLQAEEMAPEILNTLHEQVSLEWGEKIADALLGVHCVEIVFDAEFGDFVDPLNESFEKQRCAVCNEAVEMDDWADCLFETEGEQPYFYVCQKCQTQFDDHFHDDD